MGRRSASLGILLLLALLRFRFAVFTRAGHITGGALGAFGFALAIFASAVDVAIGPWRADALAPTAGALHVAGCARHAIDFAAACLTTSERTFAVLLAPHVAGATFAVLFAGLT